jgi:ubiquinone/menaquinone biosynthesis C-methylase UbiE
MRCNAAWTWRDEQPLQIRSACDLACGSGRHLIACALQHPDISFLGVDGTPEHIRVAKHYAKSLSLANVRFECADLNAWRCDAEAFDLMTCSGTFSWVPVATQNAILSIISKGLSPYGAAVIHFLTQPASHHVLAAQEVIRNEVSTQTTLDKRREYARSFASSLPLVADKNDSAQTALVNKALSAFASDEGNTLPHELLGAPVSAYFLREFALMAQRVGLNVHGDASPAAMSPIWLPNGAILDMFQRTPAWIEQQELLDMFGASAGSRRAVLKKAVRQAASDEHSLSQFHISIKRPLPPRQAGNGAGIRVHGDRIEPLTHTQLTTWQRLEAHAPNSIPVAEVVHLIDGSAGEETLRRWIALDIVRLTANPIQCQTLANGRPRTNLITLEEFAVGEPSVTSRTGHYVNAHPLIRQLLKAADGKRSRSSICEVVLLELADLIGSDEKKALVDNAWSYTDDRKHMMLEQRPDVFAEQLLCRLNLSGYFD